MDDAYEMVAQFAEKHGLVKLPGVMDTQWEHWAKIREEVDELHFAIANEDRVEIADALGDLIYVALGMAITERIDIGAVFEEIHRSNMTKDGFVDGFGKLTKGPNFSPPDLSFVGDTVEI